MRKVLLARRAGCGPLWRCLVLPTARSAHRPRTRRSATSSTAAPFDCSVDFSRLATPSSGPSGEAPPTGGCRSSASRDPWSCLAVTGTDVTGLTIANRRATITSQTFSFNGFEIGDRPSDPLRPVAAGDRTTSVDPLALDVVPTDCSVVFAPSYASDTLDVRRHRRHRRPALPDLEGPVQERRLAQLRHDLQEPGAVRRLRATRTEGLACWTRPKGVPDERDASACRRWGHADGRPGGGRPWHAQAPAGDSVTGTGTFVLPGGLGCVDVRCCDVHSGPSGENATGTVWSAVYRTAPPSP